MKLCDLLMFRVVGLQNSMNLMFMSSVNQNWTYHSRLLLEDPTDLRAVWLALSLHPLALHQAAMDVLAFLQTLDGIFQVDLEGGHPSGQSSTCIRGDRCRPEKMLRAADGDRVAPEVSAFKHHLKHYLMTLVKK